ncbi:hypothetical protein M3Y99_00161700 [Aphelenchoides fujianensis]|nr:hypothetical protein M3Y99_00161700 [Aphelenchoides fujianensis]
MLKAALFLLLVVCSLDYAAGQGLFPLFQAFQPQTPALPPKQPRGRSPNEKLHACCAKLPSSRPRVQEPLLRFQRPVVEYGALLLDHVRSPRPHRRSDVGLCLLSGRPLALLPSEGRAAGMRTWPTARRPTARPQITSAILGCLADFNKIRDCFSYYLEDHRNLKGDL